MTTGQRRGLVITTVLAIASGIRFVFVVSAVPFDEPQMWFWAGVTVGLLLVVQHMVLRYGPRNRN